MVSRSHTPRHQSTPRPTHGSGTPRMGPPSSSNYSEWNNHSLKQQVNSDRRSKSTMRYPSASRRRQRDEPPPPSSHSNAYATTSSAPSSNRPLPQRPAQVSQTSSRQRAASTGRIRNPEDDPSAVARAILDLREKREAGVVPRKNSYRDPPNPKAREPSGGSLSRADDVPMAVRQSVSKSASSGSSSGSPRGRRLVATGSNLSQEEIQANERLKKAEDKISGLLEELEELKFFQEIESEKATPQTPGGGANKAIPTSIRASSPGRNGRLPPPPKTSSTDTYRPLSPRKISKLDRNSLELECQTLTRKLQVYQQEKTSLESMVEMYEISLSERDKDKANVKRLEDELRKVSTELKKQLQNIQKGKEKLVQDYEEKLKQHRQKLQGTQEKADAMEMDLQVAKSDANKWKAEIDKVRSRNKDEQTLVDDLKSNQAVLELQLAESRTLADNLQAKVEKKRAEINVLKLELVEAGRKMMDNQEEKEEEYEVRLAALDHQLSIAKDKCVKLEEECASRKKSLSAKDKEIQLLQNRDEEQVELVKELETVIETLGKDNKAKGDELKKFSAREARKLQEMVTEKHAASQEYERRIKALQEQLKHQSDRHHAEIAEVRKQNDEKLERMKDAIRNEINQENGKQTSELEKELSTLRQSYETAKKDYEYRLKETESKLKKANEAFDREDQIRQQELDHMHNRLDSYMKDLTARDSKIRELTEKMETGSDQQRAALQEVQTKHAKEIDEREKRMEAQRIELKTLEKELQEEFDQKKSAFTERETKMKAQIAGLQKEIDQAHAALSEAHVVAQDGEKIKLRIEEMQTAFDKVQKGLVNERTRHSEVESELRMELAKLEGKLRANEASLKQKRNMIQELEDQLNQAESATRGDEERRAEIKTLRIDLEDTMERLEKERVRVKEKETLIKKLQKDQKEMQDKIRELSKLEESVGNIKKEMTGIEEVKSKQETELTKLRKDYEEATAKLIEMEHNHSLAKEDSEAELRKREKQYNDSVQRHAKCIDDLETRLEKEIKIKRELQSTVDDLQRNLDNLEEEKSHREEELNSLRKDYSDVSGLLEESFATSSKKEELEITLKKKEAELRETVHRYSTKVAMVEEQLQEEKMAKNGLNDTISDLRITIENLEDDKMKLERNLKGELDDRINRKEQELQDTIQRYTTKVADLEVKLEEEGLAKSRLQESLANVRKTVDSLEDAKMKQSKELSRVQQELEDVTAQLEESEKHHAMSKDEIENELSRKESQLRETVRRYTNTIADLEAKLEAETQSKYDLEAELKCTRSESGHKYQKQQELLQRQAQDLIELESKIEHEREEKLSLKSKLEDAHAEIDTKRQQIRENMEKYKRQIADLQSGQKDFDELVDMSRSTQNELERKEKQVSELGQRLSELLAEMNMRQREADDYKSKAGQLEVELGRKKEQLNETVDQYSRTIADLESRLDEQSRERASTLDKVESVRAEAGRKEREIKELERTIADLEGKLELTSKGKENNRQKMELTTVELEEQKLKTRQFEMEKIELETRLSTQSRAKDDLRNKLAEVTSKLERKERELRESSDRYNSYVKELESKLDDDSKTKHELQVELDKLKSQLSDASCVSSEAAELRAKVSALEQQLETLRSKSWESDTRSKEALSALEAKLDETNRAKEEADTMLNKVNGEKAEVIAALEGVIHEVQNREDEIESLSELLHKRDEELQHAKIIATKALASAKDIQKRYKEKEKDRNSELLGKIDELNDNIDYLNGKNETMQRKSSMIERELRERNMECKRLKDQLRHFDSKPLRETEFTKGGGDDVSTFTSSSGYSHTHSYSHHSSRKLASDEGSYSHHSSKRLVAEDNNSYSHHGTKLGGEDGSFSPSTSPHNGSQRNSYSPRRSSFGMYDDDDEEDDDQDRHRYPAYDGHEGAENMSSNTPQEYAGSSSSKWLADFDAESRSGFESVDDGRSESSKSRRAIERDALRKYVRKRYLKHNGTS